MAENCINSNPDHFERSFSPYCPFFIPIIGDSDILFSSNHEHVIYLLQYG